MYHLRRAEDHVKMFNLEYMYFLWHTLLMNQEADVHRHPPAGRVARRRVQVRGALLAAARHVLTTRGYHKTTLTEILRGSDVAAGTFYLHFRDKDDLFTALAGVRFP